MREEDKNFDINSDENQARAASFIEFFNDRRYRPMKFKEIAAIFQVPKVERNNMRLILEALIKEGKIAESSDGAYFIPGSDLITGTFCSTQRGFGFVHINDEEEDIFIPESAVSSAMNGDTVQVKLTDPGKRGKAEGKIVQILERAVRRVTGTFDRSKNFGFVIPDNRKLNTDIFIPKSETKNIPKGFKVVCEIVDYGDNRHSPEGRIVEVLGNARDKGVDILSIAKDAGIPTEFPEEVLKAAGKMPVSVSADACTGRLDLRNELIVTIDGVDAKDLDDAISVTKEIDENGHVLYHLGVHIADVSEYVKEGSVLDKEALARGTSVYLVDRVIPMLPVELSNGICSLNENIDRLTLSCLMDINEKGEVISHKIAETVIRTRHRMNYDDVNAIITDNTEFPVSEEKYDEILKINADVVEMLKTGQELALILRKKRHDRGSIDFDFPEPYIVLDDKGRAIDVKAGMRNQATRLIEDFMLAANETVAQDSFWQELPFLYRTHEHPGEDKINELSIFIENFGFVLRKGHANSGKNVKKKGVSKYISKRNAVRSEESDIHPKDIQKLLDEAAGTPNEALISRVTLRSMKRAKYTTGCDGHFGLAARYYCHFTSPIRRYPDLQIHRIIKENLKGELSDKRQEHFRSILDQVALSTSTLERRADDAERDADKMKQCEYMQGHIGEVYKGVISGLTSWGIFVEFPNTIEGMIRLGDLYDDHYLFDESRMEVYGEYFMKTYRLGEEVNVVVTDANSFMRTIDLRFAAKGEVPEEEEI